MGDGPSDRYAAHHADVVFAKWSLADWCATQGIAYEPWERLADVAAWFEAALADGRLPADADAFGAVGRRRPPRGAHIHLWAGGLGEGRTTAVDTG